MDILGEARRRAFSVWLRTGRLPDWARSRRGEVKYNPWHDPDDGRFTFAGTGRYFGRGGGSGAVARMHERPSNRGRGEEPFGGYGGGKSPGGGASGSYGKPVPEAERRRGNTRSTSTNADSSTQGAPQASPGSAESAIDNPRNWRRVVANGYVYRIDARGRTRRVSGMVTENPSQGRSRSSQAQAGGADRRRNDHGGHYIARRFNGPTEAFNHFAQDANFNRGVYRAMEDQWARALRQGKRVRVRIVPIYEGTSRRPSTIDVQFWINGHLESIKLPNEPRRN